jgi:hypothetical protein
MIPIIPPMDDLDGVDNIQEPAVRVESAAQAPMARKIPRSVHSIHIALDELDQELDEEEAEEAAHPVSAPHFPIDDPAESAKSSLTSHPLEFTGQFPRIAIVTTAALPWLTGTAVNPALRAAYLEKRGHTVTLLVPWVPPTVQPRLFPDSLVFHSHDAQRQHIQDAIRYAFPASIMPWTDFH